MDCEGSYPYRLGVDGREGLPAGAAVEPAPVEGDAETDEWPPRLTDYPLRHPYSPIGDLDAAEFLAEHPTWDGRGVTIAVLDANLDLLLPEFQTAYTLNGDQVPKIADFLNLTDPRDDFDLMPQWVDMRQTVTATDGQLSFEGKTFEVPRDGTYRIGLFSERRFNDPSNAAYIDQDVDRNGNPKGDDGLFGVLWDETTNDVWVDIDRDLSFSDENAMTDYIVRQDVGVFGTDDPETPVRDSIGFAVQTDPENHFVSINLGIYQHATIIMGSVVGNRHPDGRIHGVAPGARIASMFRGISNAHGLIEGLIAAFKHPLVDLIVLEQSVAIASMPYLLADATHPISIVAQRLTERYDKLLFVPGNNVPAFGFVAEDGLAPGAISVGGYQSKESYRMNMGFVPENDDNLHWAALSHGPSGAGALKPDLLAPSGQMSTDPGYRKGQLKKGLFQLPPGYTVDGGTSTATPMAAGATALVVSAAKQSAVRYNAASLKAAITGSARQIPHLAAHEQSNGLIQVAPAFELLKQLERAQPITIESRGPVKTMLSHLLLTPHQGVGLFEREGWSVGDRDERTITLTRTSGPADPMDFDLGWIGNDGTFSSPSSVTLPIDMPVAVPITVAPETEGAHTAILSIDHPSIPGYVHRVMAAIVVPHRFTADNGYTVTTEVKPPPSGDESVFVEIPPGVAAMRFSWSVQKARLGLISPERERVYPCPFSLEGVTEPCAVSRPEPGVWEINVSDNGATRIFDPTNPVPLEATPVTVTATILGVDIAVTPEAPATLKTGDSWTLELTLTNRLGKVNAAATSVNLGSAASRGATISEGEQHAYEIQVPKGTTSLLANVDVLGDDRADVDVYLLDCTEPEEKAEAPTEEKEKGNKSPPAPVPICGTAAKAADIGPGGRVEVADPKPGRWVVVVDGYSLPGGPAEYRYIDLFTHPWFGSITTTDTIDTRDPSGTWTVSANVWAADLPDPPRRLVGRLTVTGEDVMEFSGPFRNRQKRSVPLGSAELWFGREGEAPTTADQPAGAK
jgi:hypothetical protein